jgi:hypothetical protein
MEPMDGTAMERLGARAAEHHGVFTRDHALAAGFTPDEYRHLCEDGTFVAVYDNVLRFAGAPRTWRGDLLAACWAGGYRAVASHRSAAQLHGLPGGCTDVVEILCPRWRRTRHGGLTVHESRALEAADITFVDGIPCTTVERTLLDLAAVCRWRSTLELALENALRRGLVTLVSVRAMLRRLGRQGRPGVRRLRDLVEARAPEQRLTDSEMEVLLLAALRRAELPEPVAQYEVWAGRARLGRVDAAYPEARIAIEYDSDEFHTGRAAVRRDRARRQSLIAASWLPIEAGAGDLRGGGPLLCAAIRQALRDRTPTPFRRHQTG